jgi:hypothetical protein
MPLLRRGVKNIIACAATKTEPSITLQQFAIGEPLPPGRQTVSANAYASCIQWVWACSEKYWVSLAVMWHLPLMISTT